MIYGIGVDLLRVERMQKAWERHGERIARKLLSEAELQRMATRSNPVRVLAMAFAAKEAFVKALGTGFRGEIGFRDAGVLSEPSGKPVLAFSPALQRHLASLGIARSHLSLTDEGGMICAMVVLETA